MNVIFNYFNRFFKGVRNVAVHLLRNYGRRDPLRWPRDTLYPQKLVLTSPTSGGRSVGIVRLRTKSHGVKVLIWFTWFSHIYILRRTKQNNCDTLHCEYTVRKCKYEHSTYPYLLVYIICYYKYKTSNCTCLTCKLIIIFLFWMILYRRDTIEKPLLWSSNIIWLHGKSLL
jgi:hypothetical protein